MNPQPIQQNAASPARPSFTDHASRFTSPPQFGTDYDIGWIFFTDRRGLLSDGIAWFERWDRVAASRENAANHPAGNNAALSRDAATPIVTHTGICMNENAVIQAHFDTGVAQGTISDLLDSPVYFRRPRGWSVTRGVGIAASAARELGRRYNTPLILTQALANTYVGRLVNQLLRNAPNRWLAKRLGEKNAFICSQLVAFALNEQPWLRGVGVLAQDDDLISPQMLFDDPELWEPDSSSSSSSIPSPNPAEDEGRERGRGGAKNQSGLTLVAAILHQ